MTEIDPSEDTVRVRVHAVPAPFPLTLVSVTYRRPPLLARLWRAFRRFVRGRL